MYRKKPMKDVRISCLKSDHCHNFKNPKFYLHLYNNNIRVRIS